MLGKSGKDLGMIFKLVWPLVQWQQQKIHLNVAPPCKRLILQDARLNFANKRRKDAISCWAVSNAQFNATPGPARGHNNFLAFENPKTTSQPYLWNLTFLLPSLRVKFMKCPCCLWLATSSANNVWSSESYLATEFLNPGHWGRSRWQPPSNYCTLNTRNVLNVK